MFKTQRIQEVADLACLRLAEEEAKQYQQQFDKILAYFDKLSELSTEGIEPMITPHELTSFLREDEVKKDLTQEELLMNAPDIKDSLFRVPPVV